MDTPVFTLFESALLVKQKRIPHFNMELPVIRLKVQACRHRLRPHQGIMTSWHGIGYCARWSLLSASPFDAVTGCFPGSWFSCLQRRMVSRPVPHDLSGQCAYSQSGAAYAMQSKFCRFAVAEACLKVSESRNYLAHA